MTTAAIPRTKNFGMHQYHLVGTYDDVDQAKIHVTMLMDEGYNVRRTLGTRGTKKRQVNRVWIHDPTGN